MFEPVSTKVSFPALELKILDLWSRERVFARSVEEARDRKPFIFYEGPPTANGKPHPGSVLTRVMKDVILRHRSMTGHYVPRRGGWDTHGLPVEVEVEKALGISGREAIVQYGVEAFTHKCVESVFKYVDEWRRMSERVGFWIDMDQAYGQNVAWVRLGRSTWCACRQQRQIQRRHATGTRHRAPPAFHARHRPLQCFYRRVVVARVNIFALAMLGALKRGIQIRRTWVQKCGGGVDGCRRGDDLARVLRRVPVMFTCVY